MSILLLLALTTVQIGNHVIVASTMVILALVTSVLVRATVLLTQTVLDLVPAVLMALELAQLVVQLAIPNLYVTITAIL